ncbi:recombinase family protein [Sphingomonas sp. ID0503]|uniref:recombinase family protein n=1 Tax=Sphingomonas sp. ID0503 TaxID=3399691 RepID=UPI003AFAF5C9
MAKRPSRSAPSIVSGKRQLRCAIYTRKSTEEGLEQEFNSLDAQREACAAYVLSQRHEGWLLVPGQYDDGGYSGGNMERPGLKRLMAEVEAGKIDTIVVYKVDRLTRALSDFAKIVEVLDRHGASFVSVTQAFNTTTSMGRLTLNVLLSFAQFEREVTGERIRDKIAASKRKGMWMGGPVPLGYDVIDRRLVINDAEADTVRLIFHRHQELGTVRDLAEDLANNGVLSKRRVMRDGRIVGGQPFRAGALTHLLRNELYIGKVRHGDQVYDGLHEPIVDAAAWEASQALLDRNAPRPHSGHISILAGRIIGSEGRALRPEHANNRGRRYRYYAAANAGLGERWRLPAGDIETLVHDALAAFLADPLRLAAEFEGIPMRWHLGDLGKELAAKLNKPASFQRLMADLHAVVIVDRSATTVRVGHAALAMLMGAIETSDSDRTVDLALPALLKRRGHELRLVHAAPDARQPQRDDRLIQLLASGAAAWHELQTGPLVDSTRRSHLVRLARLKFLAPDIVTAIVDGRQPVELTSRTLLRISDLPLDWKTQRKVLGFG